MHSSNPRRPLRALLTVALLVLTVALLVLAAGCTGPSDPGARRPGTAAAARPQDLVPGTAAPALAALYLQPLDWKDCPDRPERPAGEPVAQCTGLKVPLDYADPGGETIDVAVSRIRATEADRRIGALVLNPGGPGNSGVDRVVWGWEDYRGTLSDHFDLVGFDPRGAGRTTPVHCLDDRTRDEWTSTDDPGYDRGRVLADACQARYATLLPHLSTRDTARDLDVLRGALGERRLDFLGSSYGTYLGALYAEEFPARTGRLALDGAFERSLDPVRLNVEAAAATETALRDFAADCAGRDDCPLGRDRAAAPQRLADFLDGLRAHPLPAADGRRLTATLAWNGTLDTLYDGHRSWERLRQALDPAITRGDATELLALADGANGRAEDGGYSTAADAFAAISCADALMAPTAGDLRTDRAELAARAPLMSRHDTSAALFAPDCRSWPYRTAERPARIRAEGSAPILVIGSTADPVTPYPWAQRMASNLADAVLLTRDGDGHTGYDKSGCVRDAVAAFLVDGTLPAAGTHCPSA
ncbi:alpha/beta hydrolase [Kitasatospora sp. NPDC058397]|uniref:alpha/beta hydrolase n=1 Tax=unclassified Kitasatospora TaxID=2633591 RepID=UPI0036464428